MTQSLFPDGYFNTAPGKYWTTAPIRAPISSERRHLACLDPLRSALVICPILYGVLTLVVRFVVEGAKAFSFESNNAFDVWSGLLLLSAWPHWAQYTCFILGRRAREKSLTLRCRDRRRA